jgi:hypothetical protein
MGELAGGPMRLTGPNENALELGIGGYQFPKKLDEVHDANWPLVDVRAAINGRSWSTRDASLLTWEVKELADWLDSVAAGRTSDSEMSFLEPNLRFEVRDTTSSAVTIRAFFDLEVRPPWIDRAATDEDAPWTDLHCQLDELQSWAEELRGYLGRFPVREVE